jgi:DNA-binding NarL/FixJ family response regulator
VIVYHNVDSAETLAMALELFGHLPRTVHTGADALREIEAFGPSVAVLDIGLRSMSGHDLARGIRAQPWGAGIVLIAVTGWGPGVRQASRGRGRLRRPPHQAGRLANIERGNRAAFAGESALDRTERRPPRDLKLLPACRIRMNIR